MKFRVRNWNKVLGVIGRKFMSTESEWNPKVLLGRTVVAILPEKTLHRVKKTYYSFLLEHLPKDWQEQDAGLVEYLVHAGDRVIDIGASIGGFTKLLSSLVGPAGRVYSFEPNPPIYDFLSHNVRRLKLSNVEIFKCALSDKQGTTTMVTPRYRWGSECHYDATLEANRAEVDCRRAEIATSTLDSFSFDRGERITFIKCDVNYHELACMRGGLQTIRKCAPALLIEILPNPDKIGGPAAQVFELLERCGYVGYWFDGQRLRKRERGERSQNYFFLTPAHIDQLPSRLLEPQEAAASDNLNA